MSVRRLCQAGNKVVFDKESYIENIATGDRTPIKLENGQYMLHMYVRKDGRKPKLPIPCGQFAALVEDDGEPEEEEEHPGGPM